ncbi:hypothetical protein CU097_003960 [Rhizopus azygosporus]|uniref:Uncharacterized protein n=1 Tax=Rhizopus azygosporus TaxID=86630 RepID=A0A367JJV9_RHIAZ|nr:hypothetical protein CU097_003960 [Rhizopus azygosporus]
MKEWCALKNYKRAVHDYSNNLHWIMPLADPSKAGLKADASRPSKKRRLNINYGAQMLFGDDNAVSNATINYNKDNNEDSPSFWKDWMKFLENNKNFHPYSPESHGTIRCGKNVSPRPNLDRSIYRVHQRNHERKEYELPTALIPYLEKVLNSESAPEYRKAIRNIPSEEGGHGIDFIFLESVLRAIYDFQTTAVDIKDGESTFNALGHVAKRELRLVPSWFSSGGNPMISMGKQLKAIPLYKDSHTYLADGILKLYGLKSVEILLLEASGCYGSSNRAKISYDHHKGFFGGIALLKLIADEFPLASSETFSKVKIFFVHGAGEQIHLWILRFESQGPLFELWLEDTLVIRSHISDKLEALSSFVKFFWRMKKMTKRYAHVGPHLCDGDDISEFTFGAEDELKECLENICKKIISPRSRIHQRSEASSLNQYLMPFY